MTHTYTETKSTYHTDRSRIVKHQRCPRSRFWEYEFKPDEFCLVPGVTPNRLSLPLVIGSAVHQGLEVFHQLCLPTSLLVDDPVEFAVSRALELYNQEVYDYEQSAGVTALDLAEDEALDDFMNKPIGGEQEENKLRFKIKEGRAMVEALVRAYHKIGLPMLLDRYNILMVEEEMSGIMADIPGVEIQLNGRADAILQDKATKDLAVLSIKTAKQLDSRSSKNWMEDDQGISECWLVQQMVKEGKLEKFGYSKDQEVTVGVQMLYLLKGYESKDDFDGIYKHHSPLVKVYSQELPDGTQMLAPKYKFYNADTGKMSTLGKAWKATQIWDSAVNVANWIDELYSQHHDVLSEVVLLLEYYPRTQAEIESWLTEASLQEAQLADTACFGQYSAETLNAVFPKHRSSCNYPGACEFKPLCHQVEDPDWGMSGVGLMLMSGGLVQVEGFKERKANHEQETEG